MVTEKKNTTNIEKLPKFNGQKYVWFFFLLILFGSFLKTNKYRTQCIASFIYFASFISYLFFSLLCSDWCANFMKYNLIHEVVTFF